MLPPLVHLVHSNPSYVSVKRKLPWQPGSDDCGDCTDAEDQECAVCIERMRRGSAGGTRGTWGACGHRFHQRCMDRHRTGQPGASCPLCRGAPHRFTGVDLPWGWRVVITTIDPYDEGLSDQALTDEDLGNNLTGITRTELDRLLEWAIHAAHSAEDRADDDPDYSDPLVVRTAMWYATLFQGAPTVRVRTENWSDAQSDNDTPQYVYVTTLTRREPGELDGHVER